MKSLASAFQAEIEKRGATPFYLLEIVLPSPIGTMRWSDRDRKIQNLLLWSEAFDNAAWADFGTPTVTPNATTAPDGTLTADKIADDDAAGFEGKSQNVAISVGAGTPYKFSIHIQSGTSTKARLQINASGGANPAAALGTLNLSLTTAWQRFSIAVTTDFADRTTLTPYVFVGNVSSDTGDIYVWGAQLEEGDLSTYVPTSTAIENTPFAGVIGAWPSSVDQRIGQDWQTPDIGDLSIEFVNAMPVPMSDLFNTVSPEQAAARLYQTFAGLPLADRDLLFSGNIRTPIEFNESSLRLDVVAGISRDKPLGVRITAADYPAADKDEIGKIKPLVWGSVKNARALAVGIGAFDLLRADIAEGATTIQLSDASLFPASGNILIGTDTIAYTGKSANDLTGASGALAHKKGDVVWESRTTYDYLMAGHAIKSVSAVRVHGLLIPAADYTLDLPNGLIKFSVQPISEFLSLHLHDTTDPGLRNLTQFPVGGTGPANWRDGDELSGSTMPTGEEDMTFAATNYGTVDYSEFYVLHNGSGVGAYEVRSGAGYGYVMGTLSQSSPGTKRWGRYTLPAGQGPAWGHGVKFQGSGTSPIIYEVYRIVYYVGVASEVSKQIPGLDFWRGAVVTWDGDGRKDDASGTITGTANALIERPDHVIKDVLINLLGYVAGDIHSASFTDAGTNYGTTYKFAGLLQQQTQARDFLAALALQCRSWFWWDGAGKAHLVFRKVLKPIDKAFGKESVVGGSLQLRHKSTEEIRNRLNIHYDKDWEGEQAFALVQEVIDTDRIAEETPWKALYTIEDVPSQTAYNLAERDYFFPFVTAAAMAQDLAEFYLAMLSKPRFIVSFKTYLPHYGLERGDTVGLTYSHFGLYNHVMEILAVSYILGSFQGQRMNQVEFICEGRIPVKPGMAGESGPGALYAGG